MVMNISTTVVSPQNEYHHFYLSEAATSGCSWDTYDQTGQTSQWDGCPRLMGLSSSHNDLTIRQSESTTVRHAKLQLQQRPTGVSQSVSQSINQSINDRA